MLCYVECPRSITKKMPIKVKQDDDTVLLISLTKTLETIQITKKPPVDELPLCRDCGKRKVTGKGMRYCEPCK